MAISKADLSKLKDQIVTSLKDELKMTIKDEIITSLKDELKLTIKEGIKDAMRKFKNYILGEIRSMQKSIEDLDAIVKKTRMRLRSHRSNSSS